MNLYAGRHQAIRRALIAAHQPGNPCSRCGQPLGAAYRVDRRTGKRISLVDLGHTDDGLGYRGLEHADRCNRAAGARLGNQLRGARRAARRERIKTMLTECALGIEISEDRAHVSIAAAGMVDGFALVELAGYLDGTAGAVDAVLALQAERTVAAVAVDPHSHAATLLRPLAAAGVVVAELSTSDVVVATGDFLDELAAGRLRHAGDPRLDAAVRHGTQRRLSGAATWDRRGATVDVGPLTAATWALWALRNAPKEILPWVAFV